MIPSRPRGGPASTGSGAVLLLLALAVLPDPAAAQTLTLSTATIEDLNAAFDSGALSSERLVEMYLARIDAYDQQGPAHEYRVLLSGSRARAEQPADRNRRLDGSPDIGGDALCRRALYQRRR